MNDQESRVAYILSQVACMYAEMEGMKALNLERDRQGKALAYDEEAFVNLPVRYGVTHNAVMSFLGG